MAQTTITAKDMLRILEGYAQKKTEIAAHVAEEETLERIAEKRCRLKEDWERLKDALTEQISKDMAAKHLEKLEAIEAIKVKMIAKPPLWPEDLPEPTPRLLFQLPGFNSDDARRYYPADYYNMLMADLAQEDYKAAVLLHESLVTHVQKEQEKMRFDNSKITHLQLPATCTVPEQYEPEDHPFETMLDCEAHIMREVAWWARGKRFLFNVRGPMSFVYEGQTVKCIGMEAFVLEWVEFHCSKNEAGGTVSEPRYYFSAVDAGLPAKLYNIPQDLAAKMFGQELVNQLTGAVTAVGKLERIQMLRAAVEKKMMADRYKDADVPFGSW